MRWFFLKGTLKKASERKKQGFFDWSLNGTTSTKQELSFRF
jgi:hypothetical protein